MSFIITGFNKQMMYGMSPKILIKIINSIYNENVFGGSRADTPHPFSHVFMFSASQNVDVRIRPFYCILRVIEWNAMVWLRCCANEWRKFTNRIRRSIRCIDYMRIRQLLGELSLVKPHLPLIVFDKMCQMQNNCAEVGEALSISQRQTYH